MGDFSSLPSLVFTFISMLSPLVSPITSFAVGVGLVMFVSGYLFAWVIQAKSRL